MKFSIILAFITVLQASASVFSQYVSINVKEKSMREVLKNIENQSSFRFFYNDQLSGLDKSITLHMDRKSVQEILDQLLASQQLSYKMLENNMIVITPNEIAQQLHVTGTVTDAVNGEPLIGVSVSVEGTNVGTVTDMNGNYALDVPSQNAVLSFTYVGYITQTLTVGSQSVLDVKMAQDVKSLEEVVVVGYGTQKKKLSTGATLQINGSDIQRLNTVSTMTALQGVTPGVQITKSSGQPGEGFKINIRGRGTVEDPSPLFIVDGLPMGNIDYLSPSDIESIDVLKDAASAAIYGSRAANGVILVTTRKGKAGAKATVSYDGYYGVQNVYKTVPLLNAQEYAMIMNEARVNSKLDPINFATAIDPSTGQPMVPNFSTIGSGTNWMKEATVKDAPIQSHTLNVAGGSDRSSYSIGLAYIDQNGIIGKPVASKYTRYNFRANSEFSVLKNPDILKIGENLTYSYWERGGIGIGNIYYNDIHDFLVTSPFLPNLDSTGNYHYAIPWNPSEANPIAIMVDQRGQNLSRNHQLTGNAYFTLQPIKGLTWRTSFGVNLSGNSYRAFTPTYNLSSITHQSYNMVTQNMGLVANWIFENTLTYNFSVLNNHHFNVLLGSSAEKGGLGESINAQNANSIFNDFQHAYLANARVITTNLTSLTGGPSNPYSINNTNYYRGPTALLSYFGRVNYDYKETYLLTAILRADASSNFAPGKRWGYFPSVSAGWILTNENFLKSNSWLSFFKLRASWGQNGNQNILPFQYQSAISFANANYFFGTDKTSATSGAYPSVLPNTNVSWETSEQTDIGFDARFFGGKMDVTFDWYNKTTKNWLVQAPTLLIYGADAPYVNGGDIRNRGVEIGLGWRSQFGGGFNYSLGANLAYNTNKVTRIANTEGVIHGPANVLSQGTDEMYRAQVGYPIGYFWGYKTAGIFQTAADVQNYKDKNGNVIQPNAVPGDVRFVDLNGDGVIDQNDKTMIGDPNPNYIFGITLGADYKGFDFSLLANGVAGNQIARSYRSFADSPLQNYTTEILGRWHGEGTSNKIPRVTSGVSASTQNISDLYIENGDFLRISNVTLGYDFKKLLPALPMAQARLYLTIQNLYTFTKYKGMDPEIGYSPDPANRPSNSGFSSGIDLGYYPSPRTVMIGASIKF